MEFIVSVSLCITYNLLALIGATGVSALQRVGGNPQGAVDNMKAGKR